MPGVTNNNYNLNPKLKRLRKIDRMMETLRRRARTLQKERLSIVGAMYGT